MNDRTLPMTAQTEEYRYARNLLVIFVEEHFPHNPDWSPLPDLIGVLTQLDNAIVIARDYKARIQANSSTLGPKPPSSKVQNLFRKYPDEFLREYRGCNDLDCIPGCNISNAHCERIAIAFAEWQSRGPESSPVRQMNEDGK